MKTGFLLDTNIPSELMKQRPDQRVAAWFVAQREESLFLSAITIGEMQKGMALLPEGKRRRGIEEWFEISLIPRFEDRVLSVTHPVGDLWGRLAARVHASGKMLAPADGLIAATALHNDLILVTRNVKDFTDLGLAILNPWD